MDIFTASKSFSLQSPRKDECIITLNQNNSVSHIFCPLFFFFLFQSTLISFFIISLLYITRILLNTLPQTTLRTSSYRQTNMSLLGLMHFAIFTVLCLLVLTCVPYQAEASTRFFFGRKPHVDVFASEDGICASSVLVHGYKCQELEVTH